MTHLNDLFLRVRVKQEPISALFFTLILGRLLPPHLRWPLNHLASISCAISPPAYASYEVFIHPLAGSPRGAYG